MTLFLEKVGTFYAPTFSKEKNICGGKIMKRIPIILDGDPGHDDAIAWVLAKGSPMLDIRGVTSVCGNQTIEKTTYNAQRICTLIDLHVPTAMGRLRPLISDPIIAPTVHGESGLDGPALPEPDFELEDMEDRKSVV